ncbi:hypothetical protein Hanom_Chr17g01537981 [Helianthus anomalus]
MTYFDPTSFLLLVSPLLFFWELIHTVRSCFRCSKNMSGKVLMAYEYAKRSAYLAIIAIKEPDCQLEQVADRARALDSLDGLSVFADVSKSRRIVVNASSAGVLHPPNGGFYTVTLPIHLAYFSVMSLLSYSLYLTQLANKKMMICDFKDVVPTMEAEPCAKAIVDGVCKGATYPLQNQSSLRLSS